MFCTSVLDDSSGDAAITEVKSTSKDKENPNSMSSASPVTLSNPVSMSSASPVMLSDPVSMSSASPVTLSNPVSMSSASPVTLRNPNSMSSASPVTLSNPVSISSVLSSSTPLCVSNIPLPPSPGPTISVSSRDTHAHPIPSTPSKDPIEPLPPTAGDAILCNNFENQSLEMTSSSSDVNALAADNSVDSLVSSNDVSKQIDTILTDFSPSDFSPTDFEVIDTPCTSISDKEGSQKFKKNAQKCSTPIRNKQKKRHVMVEESFDSRSDFIQAPLILNTSKIVDYLQCKEGNKDPNVPQPTQEPSELSTKPAVGLHDQKLSGESRLSMKSFDLFNDSKTNEKLPKTKNLKTKKAEVTRICKLISNSATTVSKSTKNIVSLSKSKVDKSGKVRGVNVIRLPKINFDNDAIERKKLDIKKKLECDKILSNVCAMNKVTSKSTSRDKVTHSVV